MNPRIRRLSLAATLATTLVAALVAPALTTTASGAERADSLSAVRRVTAEYHDVGAALAAGYVPVSGCVEGPDLGRADGDQPDQADGEQQEDRKHHRGLRGHRTRLRAPALHQ